MDPIDWLIHISDDDRKQIFLSYDNSGLPLAHTLRSELNGNLKGGFFQWNDRELFRSEVEIKRLVAENIRECDCAILFVSDDYNKNKWCKYERDVIYSEGLPFIPIRMEKGTQLEDAGDMGNIIYIERFDETSGEYKTDKKMCGEILHTLRLGL